MPQMGKKGPRRTCPACHAEDVSDPVYCTPEKRVWVGFFKWCNRTDGKHLHQKCRMCSFKWVCWPIEVTQ